MNRGQRSSSLHYAACFGRPAVAKVSLSHYHQRKMYLVCSLKCHLHTGRKRKINLVMFITLWNEKIIVEIIFSHRSHFFSDMKKPMYGKHFSQLVFL